MLWSKSCRGFLCLRLFVAIVKKKLFEPLRLEAQKKREASKRARATQPRSLIINANFTLSQATHKPSHFS